MKLDQTMRLNRWNRLTLRLYGYNEEEGQQKAKDLGIKYFETSALNGTNINEAFTYLAHEIMKKKGFKDDNGKGEQLRKKQKNKQKKDCC